MKLFCLDLNGNGNKEDDTEYGSTDQIAHMHGH
jgi:hypothetical protein